MSDLLLLPPLDRRLQNRYETLVRSSMRTTKRTATSSNPATTRISSLAATQAAWRFHCNERVTPQALVEPLQAAGRQALAGLGNDDVALLVHDWSKLDYARHESKRDVAQLTHEYDLGYELSTALLVSAVDGAPLAPMQMHLKTAETIHSTASTPPVLGAADDHLAQVLPTMEAAQTWDLPARLVHVIDREADSVGHYRTWDEAGHQFLVRADDRLVQWRDQEQKISDIHEQLLAENAFVSSGPVSYRGRSALQSTAETTVVLHRPAHTRRGGHQQVIAGRPLPLRLVISRVCDAKGDLLASWFLLTNVSADDADCSTIASWYYWRWRIESFFKLLKSDGQEIEYWQQTTGAAIFRRLLVVAMACVAVWQIERDQSDDAAEMRTLLIRLSGRQMKRNKPFTTPALLAGLLVLLPMLDLLDTCDGDLSSIRQLAQRTIPFIESG